MVTYNAVLSLSLSLYVSISLGVLYFDVGRKLTNSENLIYFFLLAYQFLFSQTKCSETTVKIINRTMNLTAI